MSESVTMLNERDWRCTAVQLMLSTDPSYDNRTIASTLKMQIQMVQCLRAQLNALDYPLEMVKRKPKEEDTTRKTRTKEFICAAFKSHTEWSNAQHVSTPTTMILPKIAGTSHSLNCFSYMIYNISSLTIFEGDPKAPFSIATTPQCKGGCHTFPLIAPLTL